MASCRRLGGAPSDVTLKGGRLSRPPFCTFRRVPGGSAACIKQRSPGASLYPVQRACRNSEITPYDEVVPMPHLHIYFVDDSKDPPAQYLLVCTRELEHRWAQEQAGRHRPSRGRQHTRARRQKSVPPILREAEAIAREAWRRHRSGY